MNITIANIAIIGIGLIIGSFINVLSYRIPQNMPVVFSRSKCPKCNINIPIYILAKLVFIWFILIKSFGLSEKHLETF